MVFTRKDRDFSIENATQKPKKHGEIEMSVLQLVALMSLIFGDTFLHMMSSCTMVIMLKSIIHHEETVKQCHGKTIMTGQRKQHLLACM